jgi:hypothetical protein
MVMVGHLQSADLDLQFKREMRTRKPFVDHVHRIMMIKMLDTSPPSPGPTDRTGRGV